MKPWHHTASRHERGYGSRWVKLRQTIIARDKALCQPCMREGRLTPFAAVDHITPKAEGGTDAHDNLQLICGACHDAKTQQEAARALGQTIKPRTMFDAEGHVIW